MLETLLKGGPVMFALLALSVYVTAITLYKTYQFWACRLGDSGFAGDILTHLRNRNNDSALIALANYPQHPLARVMRTVLDATHNTSLSEEARDQEIRLAGSGELRGLETHLKGLEMAANIAPLLGLLGTVAGMITTFAALQNAGPRVDPSLLAGGIWEALLTTVGGLAIAIPSMVAYYVIDSKIERFRHTLEETTTRMQQLDLTPQPSEFRKAFNAF